MTRALCSALALALAAGAGALAVPVAKAQPTPVQWELVGLPSRTDAAYAYRLSAVFFAPGNANNGSFDTLYVSGEEGLFRQQSSNSFIYVYDHPCSVAVQTKEGYFLLSSRAGSCSYGRRSADRGRTWERDILPGDGGTALFQSTLPALNGAVYTAIYDVWTSTSGGAPGSWTKRGEVPGEASAIGEAPQSAALPQGRLLVGVQFGGVLYSDDGGDTFTPTDGLWRAGLWPASFALAPNAADAYGGTLFAGVEDFGTDSPAAYASEDGGATWDLRHPFVAADYGFTRLIKCVVAWGPDGVLYAGLTQLVGGPVPNLGTIVRSMDGGRTWETAADGYGGWGVNALVVGRDGRIYAATERGVWRTADPLVVAGEAGPVEEARFGVTVHPNPAGGRAEVVLSLAEAQSVRVSVFDARGREVAVLLNGAARAGEQRLAVDTASWPAGVYVVRASAGPQSASARLVVAR